MMLIARTGAGIFAPPPCPGGFGSLSKYYGDDTNNPTSIPAGGSQVFTITVQRNFVARGVSVSAFALGDAGRDYNLAGLGISVLETAGLSHLLSRAAAGVAGVTQIPAALACCKHGGLDLGDRFMASGTNMTIEIQNNGGVAALVSVGIFGLDATLAAQAGILKTSGDACGRGLKRYVGTVPTANTAGVASSVEMLASKVVKIGSVFGSAVATAATEFNREGMHALAFSEMVNAGENQIVNGDFPGAAFLCGVQTAAQISGSTSLELTWDAGAGAPDTSAIFGSQVIAEL